MSNHLVGGAVGGLAVLIGVAWAIGALRARSERASTPGSPHRAGGIVYVIYQLFFAAVLMIIGLAIVGLMLLGGAPAKG